MNHQQSTNKEVLLLKNTLSNIGGLEKYTWRLANAFSAKGARVTIATSTPPKSGVSGKLNFHPVPLGFTPTSFQKVRSFKKACLKLSKQPQYDVVFGMDRNVNQTHIRAGNGVHKAFLDQRNITDSRIKRLLRPLNPLHREILQIEKSAFENPKLKVLFTNSNMVKNEVLKFYSTPEEKIQVIHNGVEWEEMQKEFTTWIEKKAKIACELHLDPSVHQFLFIGNGYTRKGLIPLLESISKLNKFDYHLSVLGKEKNLPSFIKIANELGLESNVSFFGQRKDVKRFYQLCDTLIVPSYYDPFANVTVEALAMGVQVISSPYNGGKEILTEENGQVFNFDDPYSLQMCLGQALNRPKTWMRSESIRKSVKHLDFSKQIGKIVDVCLQ